MTPTVTDIANLPTENLPPLVHVPPVGAILRVSVRPPGSKSLTNRALLLAALADGQSVLTGALADADDAQVMVRALRQLGATIAVTPEVEPSGESCGNATIRVQGVGGRWKVNAGETVTLNLNNAGTATRFLTAAALLQPPDSGGIVLDGNARMRQRPIGELVAALNNLTSRGPRVAFVGQEGYPPVSVPPLAIDWISGEAQVVAATSSSQFVSALMLIAPWLRYGLELQFIQEPTSASYLRMTIGLLIRLGVHVQGRPVPGHTLRIPRHPLPSASLAIEPDASGASYFAAAAAIVPGAHVAIDALDPTSSLQGDAQFCDVLSKAGALIHQQQRALMVRAGQIKPFTADMADMPDTAMTAAAIACFAPATSTLSGLRTLRVKETDRIAALVTELAKVGVTVEPFAYTDGHGHPDEGIRVTPPPGGIDCSPSAPRVEFDTYDDHRMAMSLALIGLRRPNVYIRDPGCVRKTYPTFWRDLAKCFA